MATRIRPPSCFPAITVAVLMSVVCLNIQTTSAAKTHYYDWGVAYKFLSPDGINVSVLAINGNFPGPTIRAFAGDTIVVNVTNNLPTEGAVIHWHGIRQTGTPWSDGPASVTQCPIKPGENFTYRFIVDKAGTFFYHGHYGMQRTAGLYGSLIVDVAKGQEEPFHYDGEFNLLLSDWWHEEIHNIELGLFSIPFRGMGPPQSLLINGRGQYNGSSPFAPLVLSVEQNKTYRFRIASIVSVSSLNFAVDKHKLKVVVADSNYVEPFVTDNVYIQSGESYSILLTANQNPSYNYSVTVGVLGQNPRTPPAQAILHYVNAPASTSPSSPPAVTLLNNDLDDAKNFSKKIFARNGTQPPPRNFDQRLILLNTQSEINGYIKWAINNVTLNLPLTPYLGAIKYNLTDAFDQREPPRNYSMDYNIWIPPVNPNSKYGNGIYRFPFNITVNVILQNANMLKPNRSATHPWHLHGHHFWVLAYGEGKFLPGDHEKFNLKNPPLRNTVPLYPYGWTAIRYLTNNPGAWFFHCHIEPHLDMGMGVILAEGVDQLGAIPDDALVCGLTAEYLMNNRTHH